jgi:hypothetical protein
MTAVSHRHDVLVTSPACGERSGRIARCDPGEGGLSASPNAWRVPITRNLRGLYHRAALRADPLAPASTSPYRHRRRRQFAPSWPLTFTSAMRMSALNASPARMTVPPASTIAEEPNEIGSPCGRQHLLERSSLRCPGLARYRQPGLKQPHRPFPAVSRCCLAGK